MEIDETAADEERKKRNREIYGEWDGISLETWVRKVLDEGGEKIVIMMMRTLPEKVLPKYRAIYKEWLDQQRE